MRTAPLDERSILGPLERREIAARTRDALAAAKRRGQRLGRPVDLDQVVRRRIVTMREAGATFAAIAAELNAEAVPTARGGRWWPSTVAAVVKSVALDAEAAAARARNFIETGELHPRG